MGINMKKSGIDPIDDAGSTSSLYTSSNTASAAIGEAVIATDEINVRSGPGLSHEIVSVVSRNESYPILEERGDWVQIQLNGGQKAGSYPG
ncbi:SH3 domain-containing protein [Bacillus licheniformis]|nr:SH3 domain-containing protein [Bacillus licheniformis]